MVVKTISKEDGIRDAVYYITRGMNPGVHTYGPCSMECGNGAIGGGVCVECAIKDLERLAGKYMAGAFVDLLKKYVEEKYHNVKGDLQSLDQ